MIFLADSNRAIQLSVKRSIPAFRERTQIPSVVLSDMAIEICLLSFSKQLVTVSPSNRVTDHFLVGFGICLFIQIVRLCTRFAWLRS